MKSKVKGLHKTPFGLNTLITVLGLISFLTTSVPDMIARVLDIYSGETHFHLYYIPVWIILIVSIIGGIYSLFLVAKAYRQYKEHGLEAFDNTLAKLYSKNHRKHKKTQLKHIRLK